MPQYIFILGHSSDLAKQEISQILKGWGEKIDTIGPNFIIGQSARAPRELMNILGGTVKIAEFIGTKKELSDFSAPEWFSVLSPSLNKIKKNNFGFSIYNSPRSADQTVSRLALHTKKLLQNKKYKARLVSSRAPDLSSVIVTKNDLLNKELIIIHQENKWLLGLTRVVQDFHKYGQRDVGRPARDDRSGLLPPKVAQMMINLAGPNRERILLDPFCGSGTILQEALLLGYTEIQGWDWSAQAVSACRQNLEWLQGHFSLSGEFIIAQSDVRDLGKKIDPHSIDLIVSEPFMGEARFIHRQNDISQLWQVKNDLENLYRKAFVQFYQILKDKGQIIFVFPIFNLKGQKIATLNRPALEKIGFKLIRPAIPSARLSASGNIVYSREHQLVQREITVWTKL